jgi:deazaflavin-dependent oxidoreductase (nitroreductase family)
MSGWNDTIIAEFEANGGYVGGNFEGAPLLLLHSTGAKSGEPRTHPMMYLRDDAGPWYVFASYAGGPKNPAWFHNLVAHPDAEISVGDGTSVERIPVIARVLEGDQRAAIYAEQASRYPGFADYEQKTTREHIPVVELTRR